MTSRSARSCLGWPAVAAYPTPLIGGTGSVAAGSGLGAPAGLGRPSGASVRRAGEAATARHTAADNSDAASATCRVPSASAAGPTRTKPTGIRMSEAR